MVHCLLQVMFDLKIHCSCTYKDQIPSAETT